MPPFLPRKRLRSPTPEPEPAKSEGKGKAVTSVTSRRPTLFDALDANTSSRQSAQNSKNLLAKLAGSDDDGSELTSLSSSESDFEDLPAPKRQRIQNHKASDNDEDEDIEFEDVHTHAIPKSAAPPPSGDLELTLTKDTRISLTNPHNKKQGPSKIERQIRIATHCMHVQFLLWHNWVRNRWICDKEVQQILVKQLGPNVQKEIEIWGVDGGVASTAEGADGSSSHKETNKGERVNDRGQRDWGEQAQKLEAGSINMSHGDPLFRLMKSLSNYWKIRFRVTAPGLRKVGYMSLSVLDEELKSFNKDPHDPERHGERIRDIKEFRACAKNCEGSRDVGAQLFTALLRGLGLEARMVVSLQPVGFGWSKNEDAAEKPRNQFTTKNNGHDSPDSEEGSEDHEHGKRAPTPKTPKTGAKKPTRRNLRGSGLMVEPIGVSYSEVIPTNDGSDNESVVDVTPAMPQRGPSKQYEKDLPPNYWVEVLSPVTNTYYAVDPFNRSDPVATNPKLLANFEPRGVKSEKAKQVMAYIVGFSPDGTVKDVTVRYLKRHMWPGKTKGYRIPSEKIPVYNHSGKIKRYEELDWFKTVMRHYTRSSKSRTEVDDHEEATDLKAVKLEKKDVKDGEETLQTYKSSTEFVLERHLRREEALLSTAKHVKMFLVKGKKGEPASEEKVFLRKDVVNCKSVETWHKEGREPKVGEQPLKRVPYRAATTNRRRELAEAEAASGEKMLQGLYSWDQTDWIIPPPIVGGKIPKNGYGNMDVFVPSMVPVGAVHIRRRRTKEICKRLGIDYAEAVTGFEFGSRMAVPIIEGIIIAEEYEEVVLEEWRKDEAERARKEDEKRIKAALGMWRKFLMSLRIVERVREEYGDEVDDNVDVLNPWTNKKSKEKNSLRIEEEMQRRIMDPGYEDMAGGFLPESHREEDLPQNFFPTRHDDDDDEGGGFIVEGDEKAEPQRRGETAYATPLSMPSKRPTQHHTTSEEEAKDTSKELRTKTDFPTSSRSGTIGLKTELQNQKQASSSKPKPKPRASSICKRKRRQLQPSSFDDDDNDEADEGFEEDSSLSSGAFPPNRRATQLGSQPQQRAVPKRKAARKSETALKSHYFIHSDDDGEDGE